MQSDGGLPRRVDRIELDRDPTTVRANGLTDRHFNATIPADEKQLRAKIIEAAMLDRKAVEIVGEMGWKRKRDASLIERKLAEGLDAGLRYPLELQECALCSSLLLKPHHARQIAWAIPPCLPYLSLFLRWRPRSIPPPFRVRTPLLPNPTAP